MTASRSPAGVTLDASLVIAHLNRRESHHREATAFLYDHADEQHWMSPLNRAEVLVGYARAERLEEGVRLLAALGIDEQPLPDDAAVRLAELRAETGLRMPDRCVLLTAEQTGSSVASFDDRLRRAALGCGLPVLPAAA